MLSKPIREETLFVVKAERVRVRGYFCDDILYLWGFEFFKSFRIHFYPKYILFALDQCLLCVLCVAISLGATCSRKHRQETRFEMKAQSP